VKFISENIFSAGDFNGKLTLFDKRQKTPLKIFKEQSEEITDILYEPNKSNFLLSSSIDSTLCVYDINKLSLYALSDKLDEELNCLMSNKNGNYILCGSGEGNILIFNWDWFGDFKDMIKGHPEGINDMDKYDDNIFFTGAEDGLVRICTMNPKGVRGILKNKDKKGGNKNNMKDVNKIKISYDKKKVITCSGIDCLRMFDISEIEFDKIYKPIDQLDSEEDIEKDNNSNSDNLEEENKDKKENEKKKEKIKKEKEENEESEEDDDDIKEMENEEEEDDGEGEEMEDDNEI
jgi:WD40 repeat protein